MQGAYHVAAAICLFGAALTALRLFAIRRKMKKNNITVAATNLYKKNDT